MRICTNHMREARLLVRWEIRCALKLETQLNHNIFIINYIQ